MTIFKCNQCDGQTTNPKPLWVEVKGQRKILIFCNTCAEILKAEGVGKEWILHNE